MLATWGASTGFNPASLFAGGEQGAWYDPSDFSTMFTTSNGATAVTAVEQAVGLILDKSKGLVLGPELITNGGPNFVNTTGWSVQVNVTLSVENGFLKSVVGGASNTATFQDITTVVGKTYKVTYVISGSTGTVSVYAFQGGGFSTQLARVDSVGDGTFKTLTFYFTATSTGSRIVHAANTAATLLVSSVTVKLIDGNHAFQSTAASRPTLRARYNLLTYSEQFNNAVWTKAGVTVTANQGVAPDGTTTADLAVVNNGAQTNVQIYQDMTALAASTSYVMSAYVKKSGARYAVVGWLYTAGAFGAVAYDLDTATVSRNATGGGFTITNTTITDVGSGWYRITVTATTPTTAGFSRFPGVWPRVTAWTSGPPDGADTGNGTDGILVWGAQLLAAADNTSTGGAYQRIAAATDYVTVSTMGGAVFNPYLSFDGTDDSLLTNSVDFSATNKMTVWGGVTKLSGTTGVITELSTNVQLDNGSFVLGSAFVSAVTYDVQVRGTDRNARSYSTYTAPVTNVLQTSITTTAADSSAAMQTRVNGVVNAGSNFLSVVSTGNFGNYPLYIGRRNNASLPFNGRIYQLIVRGAESNASQISGTEQYVAGKTGVAL